ncbi:MAG TPA: universal stress protein [Thermoanaerobaculia bacterium]|nr:universal stress protein [Thermoanaerobaculia bacterium]
MRVLLPVRPDNDCAEAARILETLFGREEVSVLRLFVYRPAEADLYDPELLTVFSGVHRLDERQLQDVIAKTKAHCRSLLDHGFHVENAVVVGFPIEKILAEARIWRADLIVLHVTEEKLREARIGRIVGSLIDTSPLPILIYSKASPTIGKRIGVLGNGAREWAERLATRQGGEVVEVREEQLLRNDCDLLVMQAHHHFAPALFGSAERRIVRHAEVPVALIPQ